MKQINKTLLCSVFCFSVLVSAYASNYEFAKISNYGSVHIQDDLLRLSDYYSFLQQACYIIDPIYNPDYEKAIARFVNNCPDQSIILILDPFLHLLGYDKYKNFYLEDTPNLIQMNCRYYPYTNQIPCSYDDIETHLNTNLYIGKNCRADDDGCIIAYDENSTCDLRKALRCRVLRVANQICDNLANKIDESIVSGMTIYEEMMGYFGAFINVNAGDAEDFSEIDCTEQNDMYDDWCREDCSSASSPKFGPDLYQREILYNSNITTLKDIYSSETNLEWN